MCGLQNGAIHLTGNLASFFTHGLFSTFQKTKMGVFKTTVNPTLLIKMDGVKPEHLHLLLQVAFNVI